MDKLNTADSLVFQTEKQLKEYDDKIPADKKATIESAVAKLKEAHKVQDLPAVDAAMQALNAAWTAASQDMYHSTQPGGAADQGGAHQPGSEQPHEAGAETGGDNVTDVPYEEVK